MLGNFYSTGQICTNGTRVFVHRSVKDAFLERLVARTGEDPARRPAQRGDASRTARQRGAARQGDSATSRAARRKAPGSLAGGGVPKMQGMEGGFWIEPTIFADVRDEMTIAREEIFGPVLSVLDFDDEDDVVARANATDFGLAAGRLHTRPRPRPPRGGAARRRAPAGSTPTTSRRSRCRSAASSSRASAGRTPGRPSSTTAASSRSMWRRVRSRAPTDQDGMSMEADFVIVGAGSAGSALAARLSEDGQAFGDRHRAWRQRLRAVHQDAGGAVLSDEHAALRLGLPDGAGAAISTTAASPRRAAR